MPARQLIFAAIMISCLPFAGCGGAQTASAVGVSGVPVMPNSTLEEEDAMPFRAGDSFNSMIDMTITTWRYEVEATAAEIKAFYLGKYPNADVEEDAGEAEYDEEVVITFWLETNNPRVEELTISIYEGWYSIGESVKD